MRSGIPKLSVLTTVISDSIRHRKRVEVPSIGSR